MIMLEESSKARRRRIHDRVAWYSGSIIFTAIILSLDLYIIFGGRLTTIRGSEMNIHVGPLFTKYCLNNETYMEIIIETGDPNYPRCIRELFYQTANNVDPPELHLSGDIMLAVWIPLLAGTLMTRMTMWRLHALAQTLISCSFVGVYMIIDGATHNGRRYEHGSAFVIFLARTIISALASIVICTDLLVRVAQLKCCPDPDMDPILIGRSFNELDPPHGTSGVSDEDECDTDFVDQHFWEPKKMPLRDVSLGLED